MAETPTQRLMRERAEQLRELAERADENGYVSPEKVGEVYSRERLQDVQAPDDVSTSPEGVDQKPATPGDTNLSPRERLMQQRAEQLQQLAERADENGRVSPERVGEVYGTQQAADVRPDDQSAAPSGNNEQAAPPVNDIKELAQRVADQGDSSIIDEYAAEAKEFLRDIEGETDPAAIAERSREFADAVDRHSDGGIHSTQYSQMDALSDQINETVKKMEQQLDGPDAEAAQNQDGPQEAAPDNDAPPLSARERLMQERADAVVRARDEARANGTLKPLLDDDASGDGGRPKTWPVRNGAPDVGGDIKEMPNGHLSNMFNGAEEVRAQHDQHASYTDGGPDDPSNVISHDVEEIGPDTQMMITTSFVIE